MSRSGDWAEWEGADHIDEAQRLCELAVSPDQSDAASAIYLPWPGLSARTLVGVPMSKQEAS